MHDPAPHDAHPPPTALDDPFAPDRESALWIVAIARHRVIATFAWPAVLFFSLVGIVLKSASLTYSLFSVTTSLLLITTAISLLGKSGERNWAAAGAWCAFLVFLLLPFEITLVNAQGAPHYREIEFLGGCQDFIVGMEPDPNDEPQWLPTPWGYPFLACRGVWVW